MESKSKGILQRRRAKDVQSFVFLSCLQLHHFTNRALFKFIEMILALCLFYFYCAYRESTPAYDTYSTYLAFVIGCNAFATTVLYIGHVFNSAATSALEATFTTLLFGLLLGVVLPVAIMDAPEDPAAIGRLLVLGVDMMTLFLDLLVCEMVLHDENIIFRSLLKKKKDLIDKAAERLNKKVKFTDYDEDV